MQSLEPRAQETFDLFISYAHADDAEGHVARFVELLRQVRDTQQYRSWQIFFDQKAIVPGDDWQQRLARVKAAGAMIVLLSPNYFHNREPQWCRWEWQAFREQEQKPPHLERIFPIYLSTEVALHDAACDDPWRKDLSRRQRVDFRDFWVGPGNEACVREALQRLERTISDTLKDYGHQRQMRRLGIPYQTFPVPPYFVPRPDDLNRVRQALLAPESGTGLVMSAVYGMGGIGKTTLAADLVRQADVRDHFEDGILWATLGQNLDKQEPRLLLSQWIVALGDHNFRSSEAGDYQTHLRSLLQHRKMLLVIDDAWSSEDVDWFLVGGERCRVLVTTRDAGIARHASAYDLDVMTPEQSRALLTGRLGRPLRADEGEDAAALAEDVGRLPLALELIAAQVAGGIPWDELREDLRREVARLRSLDLPDADEAKSEKEKKKRSLLASVNLSLGRLTAARRERFAWLGVVPDDAVVNPVMTATLWSVDERTARDELRYLREKALLLAAPSVRIGEREHPGYRLHALLHDAARHLLTSPKQPEDRQLPGLELDLPAAQAGLLSRYRRRTQQGQWHTLPEDGYIHRRLAWHFEQARNGAGLHGMLREETAKGRNGWFEANDRRGEMAVFADDVARAWRLAEEGWSAGQPAPVLGLQVRYALVTGSLNEMAGNLPPALIEALVQKQSWPPAQGLVYANRIPKPDNRADALTRLAPLFSEAERGIVLAEALSAARQISDEDRRSRALAALASHLPEALLAEALAAARQIVYAEGYLSSMLAALAPHLPEALLSEALATARQISDEDPRSRALAALVPHLSEAQRTEVLAEALATARQISYASFRAEALAALAPHLSEAQRGEVLAEALAAARQIRDKHYRSSALTVLAPHLTEAQRTEVLAEALAAARQSGREEDRSRALARLAPQLTEVLLAEALAAARQISDEDNRSLALAALVPQLPEALLAETLSAARQIRAEDSRCRALAALAPHLPEALLAEALAAARLIGDAEDRSEALAALAPHLPEAQRTVVLAEALAAARQIGRENVRSLALAALAPQLPEAQRTEVLSEALSAAWLIGHEFDSWSRVEEDRSAALAALAPYMPEALLAEALATVRRIEPKADRSRALAALASHLPEAQRTEVLSEALSAARQIYNDYDRSRALAALAPQLPNAQRAEVLTEALAAARQISDERDRWRALAALAPHFPVALLAEALSAAREINTEPLRSESILTVVSYRISLSRDEQTQFWSQCLRGLASQGRKPILEAQELLLRLLKGLTGADVSAEVAEIAHAIRDVGRWFP